MEQSLAMLASDIALFNTLSDDELDVLDNFIVRRSIEQGTTIFVQGKHGKSVCFVVTGELDVVRQESPDKEVVIATLGKGQSAGEMAIVDGFTRSASIRARTDVSLLLLKRDDFNRILEEHPSIGIKILQGLARMLSAKLRDTSDIYAKLVDS